jgi:SAM-dependent methyltransferase
MSTVPAGPERPPSELTPEEVLRTFAGWELDEERRFYLRYHYRRYAVLFACVASLLSRLGGPAGRRLLDIGASYETALFRERFPGLVVDTLGFADPVFVPRAGERHLDYDLNRAQDPGSWPQGDEAYDVVVMAEVLEHLYTAPELVLAALRGLLAPAGSFVLQTPNAVALRHRLRMVRGRNPYELFRTNPGNPGHYREYTVPELTGIAGRSGYRIERWWCENYFAVDTWRYRLYDRLCAKLPPSFRDGITAVLRADAQGPSAPAPAGEQAGRGSVSGERSGSRGAGKPNSSVYRR